MNHSPKYTTMKTSLYSTVVCLSLLVACGKDPKEKKGVRSVDTPRPTTEQAAPIKNSNATETSSTVVFEDAKLTSVYTAYLEIKKGLVNTDPSSVQQAASNLEKALKEIQPSSQLQSIAELIALTKGIDKQRDFFVTLSAEITQLVSAAPITSGAIYQQFCPMAFEGAGGYWLSDSKEIRNPYYGDKMLTCGAVKQTIE